jgi:hypothetical protein
MIVLPRRYTPRARASRLRRLRGLRRYPPDAARAWNIEDVTVYEQLASA